MCDFGLKAFFIYFYNARKCILRTSRVCPRANILCFLASSKPPFGVSEVPASIASTSSPFLKNLNTRYFIHFTGFCSDANNMLFPKLFVYALNVRFFAGTHSIRFITFAQYGRFVEFLSKALYSALRRRYNYDASQRQNE